MLDSYLFGKHLEDGEKVSIIAHKHWVIGIKDLFWPALSFFLSWVVLLMQPTNLMLYIVAIWSVASLVWVLRNFFDYYLDAWIVTDQGVIDLEWKGWFHRESAKILYSDIQGVSYEIHGLAATIFRYGTVSVEKISTGHAVSLPYVFKPRRVEGLILRNMEAYLHKKNMKNAKHVQEILAEFVAGKIHQDSGPEKPHGSHH